MRRIMEIIDKIDDEIDNAKEYAEKYIEYKVADDIIKNEIFKEMAKDELRHASFWHETLIKETETLCKVFVAPEQLRKAWEESHKRFVEQKAWISQMLKM